MIKVVLALALALVIVLTVADPALAEGGGVSATGLGRCTLHAEHAPGSGAATYTWVPASAAEHANLGQSGLGLVPAP